MARKSPTSKISTIHIRLREGLFIMSVAVACYLLLALATYHHSDPSWSYAISTKYAVKNSAGRAGAWFADIFYYLFGLFAYAFPLMLMYITWTHWQEIKKTEENKDYRLVTIRSIGFLLSLMSGCALLSIRDINHTVVPFYHGGILGRAIADLMVPSFSLLGSSVLLLAILLGGITLLTGLSWFVMLDLLGQLTLSSLQQLKKVYQWIVQVGGWIGQRAQASISSVSQQHKIEPSLIVTKEPKIKATRTERQEPKIDWNTLPTTESVANTLSKPKRVISPPQKKENRCLPLLVNILLKQLLVRHYLP